MFSFNSTTLNKKLIKLSAYEALLDFQINTLPVDMIKTFNYREDVALYNSSLFRQVEKWDTNTYIRVFGEYGSLIFSDDFNKYFAFYNDCNPEPIIRWELASLLALLELGIASKDKPIQISCKDGDYTDTFAYYFTAPDPILIELGVRSSEEIMWKCKIPFNKAYRKSNLLNRPWADRPTTLDKILKFSFYDFIQLHRK